MSKLKVPTKSRIPHKMTRYEYQPGDVSKGQLKSSSYPPQKPRHSVIEDSHGKNIIATKTQGSKANSNFDANSETVLEKNANFSEENSLHKIFVREESRSKRGVMIYKEELMEKLLEQNFLMEDRMRMERKSRTSSFFPIPLKKCDEPIRAIPHTGDSGDNENSKILPDETKNDSSRVIMKTKIAESDLIKGPSQSAAVESKKISEPGNLYSRILALEEKNRNLKDENRVLRKCLRKYQELKTENVTLTETIKNLQANMDPLITANMEMENKVSALSKGTFSGRDHIKNQNEDLKSSLSYTVSTSKNPNVKEKVIRDVQKSYSSRLLSMEQRVTDIVSILEIMKTLVVEQKLASEGSEKRFHEFLSEINAVSVLQNLHKLIAPTKPRASVSK